MTFLFLLRPRTAETFPALSRFVKIGYQLHQLAVKLVVYLLIDLFAEQFSSILVSPLIFRIGRFKKRVKLCLVLYRSVAVKRVVTLVLFGYKSDIIVFLNIGKHAVFKAYRLIVRAVQYKELSACLLYTSPSPRD